MKVSEVIHLIESDGWQREEVTDKTSIPTNRAK